MAVIFWLLVLFVAITSSLPPYTWKHIPPSLGVPSPRFDFAYGYNNNTKDFYIFGGQGTNGILGDFNIYNTASNTWRSIDSQGPSSRRDAAGVVVNNTFYIIGGKNSTHVFNEIWFYNADTSVWNVANYSSFEQVSGGSAVNIDENILYFGGILPNSTYLRSTYLLTNGELNIIEPPNPIGRQYFTLTHAGPPYNLTGLFGGYPGSFPQLSDLWLIYDDGSTWNNIRKTSTNWPSNRSGQIVVYDWHAGAFILYGGENDSSVAINDVWVYVIKDKTWTQAIIENPPPIGRIGAGAVQTDGATIVFGGVTGWSETDSILNEMWIMIPLEDEGTCNTVYQHCFKTEII